MLPTPRSPEHLHQGRLGEMPPWTPKLGRFALRKGAPQRMAIHEWPCRSFHRDATSKSASGRGWRRLLGLALAGSFPKMAASSPSSSPASLPAAVIFLHGSGDSGTGLKRYIEAMSDLLEELEFRDVQTFWPNSGMQPYTLAGGIMMPIWYDRSGLPPSAPEKTESVERSVEGLMQLVEEVQAAGVPPNRIVIGGFSMGGGIALQLALRHPHAVAGAFVLSSFMCDDAAIYDRMQAPELSKVPILMMHGEADRFIRPTWARGTYERLQSLGAAVDFISVPNLQHEMNRQVPETVPV
eukprot:symbB.v1.2.016100.t1/scaffold1215.1/size131139/10